MNSLEPQNHNFALADKAELWVDDRCYFSLSKLFQTFIQTRFASKSFYEEVYEDFQLILTWYLSRNYLQIFLQILIEKICDCL